MDRRLFTVSFVSFVFLLSLCACGGTVAGATDGGASDANANQPPNPPEGPPSCGVQANSCYGVCVDLLNDPNNCNWCGHFCGPGGWCSMGVCFGGPDAGGANDDAAGTVPPDPGGPAPGGGTPAFLGVYKLYYGDRDPDGTPDPSAWRQYGLNIDGKITTRSSTDVCTLVSGAGRDTQTDGDNGIDNSFGNNILPILESITGDLSTAANTNIGNGAATSLLLVDAIGLGPSYSPLLVSVYEAAPTASPPAWNGLDVRQINSPMPTTSDLAPPLLRFPASYMNQRTLVAAPPSDTGTIQLGLAFGAGYISPMPITHVQIVAHGVHGVISGILPAPALLVWMQQIAGQVSHSLCSGAAFQSIANAITQAADILTDGTNPPGVPCNGISIGIGFDAALVKVAGATVTVPPPANACP
jgi:hypothetical protein